jgi:hypothetical protein
MPIVPPVLSTATARCAGDERAFTTIGAARSGCGGGGGGCCSRAAAEAARGEGDAAAAAADADGGEDDGELMVGGAAWQKLCQGGPDKFAVSDYSLACFPE